jgi:hypothetical protein
MMVSIIIAAPSAITILDTGNIYSTLVFNLHPTPIEDEKIH